MRRSSNLIALPYLVIIEFSVTIRACCCFRHSVSPHPFSGGLVSRYFAPDTNHKSMINIWTTVDRPTCFYGIYMCGASIIVEVFQVVVISLTLLPPLNILQSETISTTSSSAFPSPFTQYSSHTPSMLNKRYHTTHYPYQTTPPGTKFTRHHSNHAQEGNKVSVGTIVLVSRKLPAHYP